MRNDPVDCLIIGGGPAGLTAAIYLSRFHLKVGLVDDGKSRALLIPCTHNHAGFPNGISSAELVRRMREQAQKYGSMIAEGHVRRIDCDASGFHVEWGEGPHPARTILLATGVRNRRPSIDEALHATGVAQGLIRYCPICDGFEATDKNIGVIGSGDRGVSEAVFLRSFSDRVTLIAPEGVHKIDLELRKKADCYGIGLIDGPAHVSAIAKARVVVKTPAGSLLFDTIYPALGSDINSDLAIALGADTNDWGCIATDAHQRTSIRGIYAAGDVVIGLDQISHAMGEGGVAATTIRNDLAEATPLLR